MQCTAKSKQSGERCKRPAAPGRTVCVIHGGRSPQGANHPNFKHGRYIKRDQNLSRLGEMVAQHLSDEDYLSMRDEVALLRARVEELFNRADAAPDRAVAVGLVRDAYNKIAQGIDGQDAGALLLGRSLLGQALEKLRADQEAWDEIRATTATLQRLAASDIARDKIQKEYLHARDLTLLFANLQQVILDNVPEPERRKSIQEGFRMALLEHRVLAPENK